MERPMKSYVLSIFLIIVLCQGLFSQSSQIPGGGGGGGGGSVNSVALAMPPEFIVTGSPVTSTGTLTAAWDVVSANLVFAGPATGPDDVPTFRLLTITDVSGLQTALDGKANNSVQIIAGAGLSGGGNLTANRTITLSPAQSASLGGVNSITCAAGDFINVIGTDGVPTCGTPSGGGGGTVVEAGSGIVVSEDTPGEYTVSLDSLVAMRYGSGAGDPNTEVVPGGSGPYLL